MAEILLLDKNDTGYVCKEEAIQIIEKLKEADQFRVN